MKKKYSWLLLLLCCIICCSMLPDKVKAAESQDMKIYGIYLGDSAGDAVLVESDGEYLLMDLGEADSYKYVKAFLKKMKVTKFSIYLSHMHADHTGGLRDGEGFDKITADFQVDKVYIPDKSIVKEEDLTWNYQKVEELYQENNPTADILKKIVYLNVGDSFSFGDVDVKIIGPVGTNKITKKAYKDSKDESAENAYLNDLSLVAQLKCGNTTYLSSGDCGELQEQQLIKKYGEDLKADIFKLGHHGYASANTVDFMSYVKPMYSFGLNSGATGTGFTSEDTTNHRKTYTARDNASQYGICYLVGDEKQAIVVEVKNDAVKLYKEKNMTTPLSGWVKLFGADGINEKYDYYYLDSNGKPLTGIQKIDGKTYYFGTGGCRVRGYWKTENGKTFYSGWRKFEENGSNYEMRYFEKSTGEMATGWKKIDGKTYYFDKKTGYRVSGLKKINKKTYYFGNGGILFTSRWVELKDGKRYFDSKGIMQTGFLKVKGNYYCLGDDGILITGGDEWPLVEINGKYYAISRTGIISNTGWRKYKVGKNYCYRYFDSKGVMRTGWICKSGNTYYMDPDTGYRVSGVQEIDGKYYHFSNGGILSKNRTVKIGNTRFKFDKNGAMKNVPKINKTKIKSIKAGKGSLTVTWAQAKKVDGYEIYIATKEKGKYKKVATVTKAKTVKCKIKKLSSKKNYYVKIRAYKEYGEIKIYSAYSAVSNKKTK